METEDTLIESFLQVTAIPGVSLQEGEIVDFLERELKRLGFEFQQDGAGQKLGSQTGNLICKVRPKGMEDKPVLLLSAHVDTVSLSSPNPQVTNGKICTNDGLILGADDRVGVTILLHILRQIAAGKIDPPNLDVVFVVAEELGLKGSKNLDFSLLEATRGVNLDASAPVGSVIYKAPSKTRYELEVQGRSAHAAVAPEEGVNAIFLAAHLLRKMQNLQIPSGFFNVASIEGGGAINVIPDKVRIKGEIRSFEHQEIEDILQKIEELGEETCQIMTPSAVKLNYEHLYKAFELPLDRKIVHICKSAIERVGVPFQSIIYRAGSDANIYNQNGIETVNLGLGYVKNHSPEEFITVNDLVKGAMIGEKIVCEFAELSSAGLL